MFYQKAAVMDTLVLKRAAWGKILELTEPHNLCIKKMGKTR